MKTLGVCLIHQRNRAVLHFGGRISFGMNVADFLQLQRPFQSGREIVLTPQVEEVVELAVLAGDLTHVIVGLQRCRESCRAVRAATR